MAGFSRAQLIGLAILILLVIAAPFLLYPIVVMQVMCYALFAMGTNLLMGSVGLLSLGQAAYFGLGGYVAGYLVQSAGLHPRDSESSPAALRGHYSVSSSAGSPSGGRIYILR